MKPRTEKSMELYEIMLRRGYPEPFCDQITRNLNTDWTAQRMIGYLSHYKKLPMEDVADEMLAILSDRNRIMQKKELESGKAKWNEYLNERCCADNDEEKVKCLVKFFSVGIYICNFLFFQSLLNINLFKDKGLFRLPNFS